MDKDSELMRGIQEMLQARQTSQMTPCLNPTQETEWIFEWHTFEKYYTTKAAEYGLDNPGDVELMAKIAAHATEGNKGVMLGGCVGNGKTKRLRFMAEVMGIEYRDARALAIDCAGLKRHSGEFMGLCNCQEYSNIVGDKYHRKHDLIIDDLGAEASTQSHYGNRADVMATIIDARWDEWERYGWRTFFATNLSTDFLKGAYGERTFSRLLGMCKLIALPGGDRRAQR